MIFILESLVYFIPTVSVGLRPAPRTHIHNKGVTWCSPRWNLLKQIWRSEWVSNRGHSERHRAESDALNKWVMTWKLNIKLHLVAFYFYYTTYYNIVPLPKGRVHNLNRLWRQALPTGRHFENVNISKQYSTVTFFLYNNSYTQFIF